jgi:hypothetical protein
MTSGEIQRHDAEGVASILAHAPQNAINIHLLLGHVVDQFGGLEAFAEQAFTTYSELPAKSPARERMITNIMRLIAAATTPGAGPLPASEQEMKEEFQVLIEGIASSGD